MDRVVDRGLFHARAGCEIQLVELGKAFEQVGQVPCFAQFAVRVVDFDDQRTQFGERLDRIVGRDQPVEFASTRVACRVRFLDRPSSLDVGEHRVPRPAVILAVTQVERLADEPDDFRKTEKQMHE